MSEEQKESPWRYSSPIFDAIVIILSCAAFGLVVLGGLAIFYYWLPK